jgi:hypothetical protein
MWTSLMTRILTDGQTFADHISIWLLFIFQCFVLRAQNDSARTSRQPSAICIYGLTISVLHLSSRLYSCGHDALRNARCYRRLQHWEEHLLTWYLLWEITLIIDYCAIKGCKQQRDKHLRQFIIAWYGIALGARNPPWSSSISSWNIVTANISLPWQPFQKCCRGGNFRKRCRGDRFKKRCCGTKL